MLAQQRAGRDAGRGKKAAETERIQPLGASIYRWRNSERVCMTENESPADVYIAAIATVTCGQVVSGFVMNLKKRVAV